MSYSFLVLTYRHGLLPLAQRLRAKGHHVDLIVWRERYEKAWAGKLNPKLRSSKGELKPEVFHDLRAAAEAAGQIVVSDLPPDMKVSQRFQELNLRQLPVIENIDPEDLNLGAGDLRVGGWFDGESLLGLTLLVYDWGVWPGGLGTAVPGGLTQIVPKAAGDWEWLEEPLRPYTERLKSRGFVGLVSIGLGRDPEAGGLRFTTLEAGLRGLHLDAWLSSLEHSGQVLAGEAPPIPQAPYTVVVPVSIPPWPNKHGSAEVVRVRGLPPQLQGRWFWRDINPDEDSQELWTAGTDGLVGVARGEGHQFETARLQAVGLAQKVELPEKQFRADVGLRVPTLLAQLEQLMGLVV